MTDWMAAARRVADTLAEDAAERDRNGKPPTDEVELVRGAGLLPLLVPADRGGLGKDWRAAMRAVRIVGAADASVGHLLGYHYVHLWRASLFDPPATQDRLETATARHNWFWAGVANPRDPDLTLTPTDGGFVADGRKSFATGASVADRLVVTARRADTGADVTFTIAWRAPGLRFLDDWDHMGQRLTASGAVELTAVPVDEGDLLGTRPPDGAPAAPRWTLAPVAFQLVLTHVLVAIAEGALAAAGDYTRTSSRPFPAARVCAATDDPYVRARYGELVAHTAAAAALADRATAAFERADGEGFNLGPEQRGTAALAVSQAKVVAAATATDVASSVFELTGARSAAAGEGLDRFWRNARTLTLHDPLAYKAREVGDHFLSGALPPVTGYS